MSSTAEDWDVFGRTIFGEARGESFQAQVAMAWSVRNRADAPGWWGGPDLASVCRKKWQFSCWNDDDPNLPIILAATVDDPHFLVALGVAALVMQRQLPDPTGGATNYYDDSIPMPAWAKTMIPLGKIGHFLFYREA